MRLAAAVAFAALGGCSALGGAEESGEAISCALGGAQEFSTDCRLERVAVEGAEVLVVRHSDGSFRRLEVSADAQSLNAADGAALSQSARKGETWEVILDENRYVIPVKGPVPHE